MSLSGITQQNPEKFNSSTLKNKRKMLKTVDNSGDMCIKDRFFVLNKTDKFVCFLLKYGFK
jgi:hypothetical protein